MHNYFLKDGRQVNAEDKIYDLRCQIANYRVALTVIAAPMRPDGTFNRDREACQKLAEEALKQNP